MIRLRIASNKMLPKIGEAITWEEASATGIWLTRDTGSRT